MPACHTLSSTTPVVHRLSHAHAPAHRLSLNSTVRHGSLLPAHPFTSTHTCTLPSRIPGAFFYSEGLTARLEQWTTDHAHLIDLDLPEGESAHHYTNLHGEWCAMYEKALQDFLAREGATSMEFYETLLDARKARDAAGGAYTTANMGQTMLVGMIDATADYQFWLEMMVETAQTQAQDQAQARQQGRAAIGGEGKTGEGKTGGGGDRDGCTDGYGDREDRQYAHK